MTADEPRGTHLRLGVGFKGEHCRRHSTLQFKAVGTAATVTEQLQEFVERTGHDELVTVTNAYDPAVRDRSLKLLADAWF